MRVSDCFGLLVSVRSHARPPPRVCDLLFLFVCWFSFLSLFLCVCFRVSGHVCPLIEPLVVVPFAWREVACTQVG